MIMVRSCEINDRPGLLEIDLKGRRAVVANRSLFRVRRAARFAVVDTENHTLGPIYSSIDEAVRATVG